MIVEEIKNLTKKEKSKYKWIKTRMWFSTFISALYRDAGIIPPNIGNKLVINNNIYITKYSLNEVILIKEFSAETPKGFISKLIKHVKDNVDDVIVDVTIKGLKYNYDLNSSGLKSRERQWIRTLDNPNISTKRQIRTARLLNTKDIAKKGVKLSKGLVYITLRANSGVKLSRASELTKSFLESYNIEKRVIKSDLLDHLKFISLISNRKTEKINDTNKAVLSPITLAQLLPTTQGMNDYKGSILGIERRNRSPYVIDFRSSAAGKNILVEGISGFGKTFLVLTWGEDFYATDYNICIQDIKGEFLVFANAHDGVVLDMTQLSRVCINTFRLDKADIRDNTPSTHFKNMLTLSRYQLVCLCDFNEDRISSLESLLDEFLESVYLDLGAIPENPNTWYRTKNLNHYEIFNCFQRYLSSSIREKYTEVATKAEERLSMYIKKGGTLSYSFSEEYKMIDLLDTRVLVFNFGISKTTSVQDRGLFNLHVLYMDLINDYYGAYKKSNGEWVVEIMEESNYAQKYMIQMWEKKFTTGRSQNKINIMLGNSIGKGTISSKIVDNINILVLGHLNKTTRKYIIEEFDLHLQEERLKRIVEDSDYENTFVLINRMQKNSTNAILKAMVPAKVRDSRLFKTVDTDDN